MALIIDPDYISQGTATAVTDLTINQTAGANAWLNSAGSQLPSGANGDYIEIRGAADANNNGLWVIVDYQDAGNVYATKVTGGTPVDDAVADTVSILGNDTTPTGASSTYKTVMIDTELRKIHLLTNDNSNLTNDGVTLQAIYSFLKEEWKNDDTLNPHPFPMVAITPEQFEFIYDWEPINNTTRKLIRTGGWKEIDTADGSKTKREYAGVISLGSFEDTVNDTAYYQLGNDPTDTASTTDFTFSGPVNEAILTYVENVPADAGSGFIFSDLGGSVGTIERQDAGDWVTDGYRVGGGVAVIGSENTGENDGTWTITAANTSHLTISGTLTNNAADTTARFAVDNRSAIKLFLRIRDGDTNGKTYGQSTLADIGVTTVTNQVYRFPLTNATDLKISSTDATIGSSSPWNQIFVRYFDQAFSREVDSATPRNFGIVIDVGTFSGVDGGATASGTSLSTAEAGIPSTTYDGGTLTIHEGSNAGTYTITTASGGTVNISGTFPATDTNMSFTLQRSSPVVATAEEIYEKVQYFLRQAADIDSTDQTVTGKTADALLRFVGDTLEAGQASPTNPNGGGSGVIIEGFDSNDTNRLTFYDNTGTSRNYPFVAAGSIAFNDNLVDDGAAEYWMFYTYTERFTASDISIGSASGNTATFSSTSAVDFATEFPSAGAYFAVSGMPDANNNGIWITTAAGSGSGPYTLAARKVNGDTVSNQTSGSSYNIDKNPVNSADAIIVNDNSGSPITGTISSSSVSFDFDYDGNVQGGRTAGTNAVVTLRAIGLNSAQFVESTGTITRSTGLGFSLVAGLERNYQNP